MTALLFLASLAAILAAVIAIETANEGGPRLQRPTGLLTWLTHGNWPAKVGGALVIVGVGALLRYAFIHIEIEPQWKLAAGVVAAFALAGIALFIPEGPNKRAVTLALNGAAFGVAYMTAYSAFGLFGYLSSPKGLALLAVTSAAAAVYAITRSAISLALLSMVGAYLAPAFAVGDPGPAIVYGYYLFASILTLVMVSLRGWRPLIHLSFLFTLAGGAFFAWTADYFTASNANVMIPMVLALSAVHVAMPLLERGSPRGMWLERLDVAYMLALPVIAALLVVKLAPNRADLAVTLGCLGVIWAVAAVVLKLKDRPGAGAHAVIAGVLLALGAVAFFGDLPWEMIMLAFAVGALAAAAWRVTPAGRLHSILAGIVLLFGAIHVLSSIGAEDVTTHSFGSEFAKRIIAAALLITAGAICRRIRQALDTLLLAVGIVWAVIAIGIELISWKLATFALVLHWVLLLLAASLWIPGRRVRFADRNVLGLSIAIVATAVWASAQASEVAAWIGLFASVPIMIGMAMRPQTDDEEPRHRLPAVLLAPAVGFVWALKAGTFSGFEGIHFALTVAAIVAMGALLAGRLLPAERGAWVDPSTDTFGMAFAALLGFSTLLSIVREPWAIAFEVACLAGLALVAWIWNARQRPIELWITAFMIGLALVLQANLLRVLGPPGDLDISDVLHLKWAAGISLLWAIAGMALTLWSRKIGSRALWISGAMLLVASAAKVVLIDFGSLGQLANILAVIAAGVVFLLVGWLAPMPPPREAKPAAAAPAPAAPSATDSPIDDAKADASTARKAWMIAIVIALGAFLIDNPRFARKVVNLPRAENLQPQRESQARQETADAEARQNLAEPAPEAGTEADLEAEDESQAEPDAEAEPTSPSEEATAEPEPDAESETARRDWVPPPAVDESGTRTYTQYTAPHLQSSRDTSSTQTSAPPAPAAGEQGLDQLLREGRMRRATQRDVDAWVTASGSSRKNLRTAFADPQSGGQFVFRTFVVQREMTFPAGLHGAHLATFIVPRGVPRPFGDPGHSQVLETP